MDYVMLDTSVLVNCTLVNATEADPELLVTISDKMRKRGMRLLLPSVIQFEYRRKVPEELSLIRQQSSKFRKLISTELLTAPDVSLLHSDLDRIDAKRETAVRKGQKYFEELEGDETLTTVIPLTGDIVAEAIGYSLGGRKPSKGPIRCLLDVDSLIVASVACYARSHALTANDTVLICSDNHSDYGAWDEVRKRHVVAPDIQESLPCSVRYYKSPRGLVEEELEVVVEEDEPLADALEKYDDYAKSIALVGAAASLERIVEYARAIDPYLVEPYLTKGVAPRLFEADFIRGIDRRLSETAPLTGVYADLLKVNLVKSIDPEILRRIQSSWLLGGPAASDRVPDESSDDEEHRSGEEPGDQDGEQ